MAKRNPVIVFKLGGEILRDEKLLEEAMREIIRIKKHRPKANIILVHGAGPQIDKAFRKAGIEIERIGGKRITRKEGLDAVWKPIIRESQILVDKLSNAGLRAESIEDKNQEKVSENGKV